jgi:hypothetical protein
MLAAALSSVASAATRSISFTAPATASAAPGGAVVP